MLKPVVKNCKVVVFVSLWFFWIGRLKLNGYLLVILAIGHWLFCILLAVFFLMRLCLCRANKDVVVYACDCSDETLERAKEIINAATVVAFKHRFHTFCCDLSTNEFPNWLACNPCRDKFLQKQSNCLSGCLLYLFFVDYTIFMLLSTSYLVLSVSLQMTKGIMECILLIHPHQKNLTVVLVE